MKHIVTHGGGAHRDDFVACCLLLGQYGYAPVFRRDPTQAELDDPAVAVVDVGQRYEPRLLNFDHHQPGARGCALTQVLDYLGLLTLGRKVWPWLQVTEDIDTKGPYWVAKQLGIDKAEMVSLVSPVEGQVLAEFGRGPEIPEEFLRFMHRLGSGLLTHLKDIGARLNQLAREAVVIDVKDLKAVRVDTPLISLSMGLEVFIEDLEVKEGCSIVATITRDDHGEGWCLYRRNDHPRVNLSLLEGKKGVRFAHKSGFLAKLTPDADPLALLLESVI